MDADGAGARSHDDDDGPQPAGNSSGPTRTRRSPKGAAYKTVSAAAAAAREEERMRPRKLQQCRQAPPTVSGDLRSPWLRLRRGRGHVACLVLNRKYELPLFRPRSREDAGPPPSSLDDPDMNPDTVYVLQTRWEAIPGLYVGGNFSGEIGKDSVRAKCCTWSWHRFFAPPVVTSPLPDEQHQRKRCSKEALAKLKELALVDGFVSVRQRNTGVCPLFRSVAVVTECTTLTARFLHHLAASQLGGFGPSRGRFPRLFCGARPGP